MKTLYLIAGRSLGHDILAAPEVYGQHGGYASERDRAAAAKRLYDQHYAKPDEDTLDLLVNALDIVDGVPTIGRAYPVPLTVMHQAKHSEEE